MKIFLDTADTEVIKEHFETGLIDGITTNPTLIRKSGRDPEDVYQELVDIGIQDISMEVVGDAQTMLSGASRRASSLMWGLKATPRPRRHHRLAAPPAMVRE